MGDEIVVTGFVSIESLNGQVIELSNTATIKAGNEIKLKNNIPIPFGSDIILKSTKNSDEISRDCDEPCIFVPNFYNIGVSANLDVAVTNIEAIRYELFDQSGSPVNQFEGSIHFDDKVSLFELPPPNVYFSVSEYIACTGEIFHITSSVTVMEGEEYSPQIPMLKNSKDSNEKNSSFNCYLYPNPLTGIVNIQFSNPPNDEFEMNIIYVFGKTTVLDFDKYQQTFSIDLSPFPKGIYLLMIKTNERIFTEKIVLQ